MVFLIDELMFIQDFKISHWSLDEMKTLKKAFMIFFSRRSNTSLKWFSAFHPSRRSSAEDCICSLFRLILRGSIHFIVFSFFFVVDRWPSLRSATFCSFSFKNQTKKLKNVVEKECCAFGVWVPIFNLVDFLFELDLYMSLCFSFFISIFLFLVGNCTNERVENFQKKY